MNPLLKLRDIVRACRVSQPHRNTPKTVQYAAGLVASPSDAYSAIKFGWLHWKGISSSWNMIQQTTECQTVMLKSRRQVEVYTVGFP
ncbi:hypothetical protein GCG54_00001612 [Colletotrichum gloeosporioides]|uniref:Uncharacterized protein n=1 Tax=Colletotrichum gloeosporioides TaxID=474922 RepID=A0A8H4FR48_COLGL|nr:uncharacterized protein GCG54_00001612 [Colletotrichum gloeosporioides]KAF3811296.1 hypothetical protein GCG54_00001612 [Colletotrichum gloeosporioides]